MDSEEVEANEMTAKRKLIYFLLEKQKILAPLRYIYLSDLREVQNCWSDERCKEVIDALSRSIIIDNDYGICGSTCPWCIYNGLLCSGCGYAEAHGICEDDGSDYMINFTNDFGIPSNRSYRRIMRDLRDIEQGGR